MRREKYWIVIGERPSYQPYRHSSRDRAHEEAVRLASQHEGIEFTVFEAIESSVSNTVSTTVFEEPPPF